MDNISRPKVREGTWLWLIKIIGGLLIVLLLALHFVVNHLVAPGGLLNYQDVVRYYQNAIVPIVEISFLAFVVIHSLLGMRSIILDLNPSDRVLRWIDIILVIAGVFAITYGIWLAIIIAGKGNTL